MTTPTSGQHTPGPWKVTCAPQWWSVSEATGYRRTICRLIDREGEHPIDHRESEASARLIAAAPAMLQALRCALADLEGIMPDADPSGDRVHPGWTTIAEIEALLATVGGRT